MTCLERGGMGQTVLVKNEAKSKGDCDTSNRTRLALTILSVSNHG